MVNLTKSQLHVPSIISNITDIKNNVDKPVTLTSFQKPQLQSILKFVHQCLLVFYGFTQFDGSFHCLNFDEFFDTASLIIIRLPWYPITSPPNHLATNEIATKNRT